MNQHEIANEKGIGIGIDSANIPLFGVPKIDDLNASIFTEKKEQLIPLICDSNPSLNALLESKRLLMLQGPVGPLFNRISAWKLAGKDKQVHRIIFNGGDEIYCDHAYPIRFEDGVEKWPAFLQQILLTLNIDSVLLFGQTRIYHQDAIRICKLKGIAVFVMEEGYVRPGFLTLETDGVNAWSRSLSRFKWSEKNGKSKPQPQKSSHHRLKLGFHILRYYLVLKLRSKQFPKYKHHRHDSLLRYASYWMQSAISLVITRPRDKFRLLRFENTNPNFFFVPLQLDSDSQIIFHSCYSDVWEFLASVMRSFAKFAYKTDWLVVKQHPLARGKLDMDSQIMNLARELGISERILFIQDCRVHDFVNASNGVVTVNSTVGIQAIYCARPLKVMGEAIYKTKGIADSQPLDNFWTKPQKPDANAASLFYESLIRLTQVPGMLYDFIDTPLNWQKNEPSEACN